MLRRYAIVRQDDGCDCGAAALATVARHYRRPLSLQQLRDLTGTDRAGTNLLALRQAAEKVGFSARAVQGDYDALGGAPLPAVAHFRTDDGAGHFVVLHRVGRGGVVVADPARGVEKLSRDDFARRWTGYLLLLTPDAPPADHVEAAGPWRRFLTLLSAQRGVLGEAFACALLMTLLGVSTSYFVQHLVDSVLSRNDGKLLNALGVGMALVLLFRALFGVLRQYLVAHVGRKVGLTLIARFSRHLIDLPLRFFETRRVGEVLTRYHDAEKVREAVGGTTLTAVVDGTLVLLLLAVLWAYDGPLALVATAFVPLLLLSVAGHHPAARRTAGRAMENDSRLCSHLVENVSGVETVKAFGAERARAEEGEQRLVHFVQSVFRLEALGISMRAVGMIVTGLAGLAVLWYGGHRVMAGALTVGQLLFFYTLLAYLLDPLERLAQVNLRIQEAIVALDRLGQVLDLPREADSGGDKVPFTGLTDAIHFHGVSFSYGCRGNVLEGVDLTIPAGKKVAIVGESGSGKSTLIRLLLGFHAPTAGRLLLDGVDVGDVELASLRQRVGLVSQEPFVFNGTVRENIALGRPDATLAEVIEAARLAGLADFIATLPRRYDTPIGERGANLSGGQRQRLAIARALLRRPDVLIFDEATSHLDTATERAIQECLRTALAGKTVIVVAHRLSTIQDADLIYVLRDGRVAEKGTHEQLLGRRGWYAGLCRGQSEARSARNGRRAEVSHA